MKIVLARGIKEKITLLLDIASSSRGFVIGSFLGQNLCVTDLLSLPENTADFSVAYNRAYDLFQEKLLGTYFIQQDIVFDSWMVGDIILVIGDREVCCYTCDYKEGSFVKTLLGKEKISPGRY